MQKLSEREQVIAAETNLIRVAEVIGKELDQVAAEVLEVAAMLDGDVLQRKAAAAVLRNIIQASLSRVVRVGEGREAAEAVAAEQAAVLAELGGKPNDRN